MWSGFAAATVFDILFLLVPGTIILSSLQVPVLLSICLATPISIALYSVLGQAFSTFSLYGVTPIALSVGILLFIALASANLSGREKRIGDRRDSAIALLYALAGVVVVSLVFLSQLHDGAGSFLQFNDNATHLGYIKSMSESGVFATIGQNSTPLGTPASQTPYPNSSFYPMGFHIVAAFSIISTGAETAVAENAMIFTYAAIVYPLGMCGLLRSYTDNPLHLVCGAVICMACVAFPSRMLFVHQAYPNLAGFAAVPSVVALFRFAFPTLSKETFSSRTRLAFIFSLVGLLSLHANTLFTVALYIGPIILTELIPSATCNRNLSRSNRRLINFVAGTILITVSVVLWLILLNIPFLTNVTSFLWNWTVDVPHAIYRVVALGLRVGSPQLALALFVLLGVVFSAKDRTKRSALLAYALFCCIFIFNSAGDANLKRLFAGFWYTDPERTAAMVAIAAVPVATLGLSSSIRILAEKLSNLREAENMHARRFSQRCISISLLCAFMILGFFFTFKVDLCEITFGRWNAFRLTSTSVRKDSTRDEGKPLSYSESRFIEKCIDLIGTEQLVLNNPYDGSVFAYATSGLNTYYKAYGGPGDTETSFVIRTSLSSIGTDDTIRNAVAQTGAQYYIKLDMNGFDRISDTLYESDYVSFNPNDWVGVLSIDDNTPGFEIVLQEGNYRLYRIV